MSEHIYNIPTGTLKLDIKEGNPEDFFRVEARHNPKRGFLFVSKVLGKHIAVESSIMANIYTQLAEKALKSIDTNKKTLVIGMAETATLLGYGVYEAISKSFENKENVAYIQSTRYPSLNALPFEEAHSHAPSQFIHLNHAETYEQVVLVDDELSTGNTFVGFEEILFSKMTSLEKITWVCLTDFRKQNVKDSQKDIKDVASLLSGEWEFEWVNKPESLPSACENINSVDSNSICGVGRYTEIKDGTYSLSEGIIKQIEDINPHGKTLIIGSGEFMPLPYLLMQHVRKNFDIKEAYFQATTRSPALMKGLSWECDHYEEGVRQYIYNYTREDYDTVIFCVETEVNHIVKKMIENMGAKIVTWK